MKLRGLLTLGASTSFLSTLNKMRIYVFSKETEKYAPQRILEEAVKLGHEVENLFYKNLTIRMNKSVTVLHKNVLLENPDAVVLRVSGAGLRGPLFVYQRVALIDSFPSVTRVMNKETYQLWPRLNKMEQHYGLVRNGLPVIPSVSFSSEDAIDWKSIEFPLIAKTSFGSSGQGVFKIDNKEGFLNVVAERGINNLIFQKFLPTRQDFRVIVIGGTALPRVMRKTAQEGQFLTNFVRGGRVEGVELTGEMKDLAERTAKIFQADYAGVDIMYDEDGKPYILEINRGAQFQGFEQSTGINVAREIVLCLQKAEKSRLPIVHFKKHL